jgi:hypothetical protein
VVAGGMDLANENALLDEPGYCTMANSQEAGGFGLVCWSSDS